MARYAKTICLRGIFEEEVLGIFKVIRGFADLRDLAQVSVSFEMNGEAGNLVTGFQRKEDEEHAKEIKTYLEKSDTRFFPEIILSIRTKVHTERWGGGEKIGIWSNGSDGIMIKRPFISKNIRVQDILIEKKKLSEIRAKKLIRRIDGNHRLFLADKLKVDVHSPRKYIAPFCIIILDSSDELADDYTESKIFHTINSKARLLDSEHALKLLLGQDPTYSMTPAGEFEYDPGLHLTRLLRDKLNGLAPEHCARLGTQPLTSLNRTAESLIALADGIKINRTAMQKYAEELFPAITECITILWRNAPQLCKAEFFIELAACVWMKFANIQDSSERINVSIKYLEDIAAWFGKGGFTETNVKMSFARQTLDVYERVRSKIPKRVFLARWYPTVDDGDEFRKANNRRDQIQRALDDLKTEDIDLALDDPGTRAGGTFLIHDEMYKALANNDIILIDLTGCRPNVCIEAGYALKHHEKNRLLFIFQKTEAFPDMPFDLKTFRYEPIQEAADIPDAIKKNLREIVQTAMQA